MSAVSSLPQPRAIRLGFLGLGWIGRKRLDSIANLPQLEIAALSDANAECLDSAAQTFPGAHCTQHFEDLLACDLDGVIVATPSALHAEQAIAALQRGLAVFCQKPLAITAADTRRVVAAAQTADRLLGVDYCYRHVSGMPELRARIRAGELGEVFAADLRFHNAYAPSKAWCRDVRLSGGGCLVDLGVHLIDLLLWLLDYPAVEVRSAQLFAQGRPVRDAGELEDFALAELELANGAALRLACSWNLHAGRDALIDFTLHGTRAGAAWRNVNGSFYDFEVQLLQGARSVMLGAYPDEWGARALTEWVYQLQASNRFDAEACGYIPAAQLIDDWYRRGAA